MVRRFSVTFAITMTCEALSRNFERIVLSAYHWLVENYQPGDCIYLFGSYRMELIDQVLIALTGFSRGAYQVRVIAGMIEKVGTTRTSRQQALIRIIGRFTS